MVTGASIEGMFFYKQVIKVKRTNLDDSYVDISILVKYNYLISNNLCMFSLGLIYNIFVLFTYLLVTLFVEDL